MWSANGFIARQLELQCDICNERVVVMSDGGSDYYFSENESSSRVDVTAANILSRKLVFSINDMQNPSPINTPLKSDYIGIKDKQFAETNKK